MRRKTVRYFSLIAGLLVAASVIFSQSVSISQKTADSAVILKANDQDSPDHEENTAAPVTLSVTSLPSPTVIHFTSEAFCLFEIFYTEKPSPGTRHQIDLPLTKFFSTLLNVIISPNAP